MKDNDLIRALRLEITKQLSDAGLDNFQVLRHYQPSTQAVKASALDKIKTKVYVQRVTNNPINPVGYATDTAIVHNFRARIQINVLHYFDINDPDELTAEDVCQLISSRLFTMPAIESLRSYGVRLESRGSITNSFFVNEASRYESNPSFDLIVTYQSNGRRNVDSIVDVTGNLKTV